MESCTASAPKGRPREFCTDAALAAALGVFWSQGYEGASMAELTEAMGITKPSLYAAFGNKEALFRKALDLYEREKLDYMRKAIEAPTARDVAHRLLHGALANQASSSGPKGCLSVISSVACSVAAESIRQEVIARRASSQRALLDRFERAKAEGDLSADTDVQGLASYVIAILQGMAVQAGAGATHAELERLIDTGLAMWPAGRQAA